MTEGIFSPPRTSLKAEDCYFYHVMNLPGVGQTTGEWDLRPTVEDYLGGYDFDRKRVLEIGPASGFLTVEMERRGAEVVAVEVTDDPGWDFVPFPEDVLLPSRDSRRRQMHALKNSWWYVHEKLGSRAQMYYGDAYNLPDALGDFDVAVLAAVLTHCRSPVQIMHQCAKRSKSIIVAENFRADLEGRPVCLLNPSKENKDWGTWWYFTTQFFTQYLEVMGFRIRTLKHHSPRYRDITIPQFTIVADRI